MRKSLPLILAGIAALALGVLGTAALASSVKSSPTEAAAGVDEAALTTGVYGTR
ncbi:hypothetical protein [Actinoplanes couchii]|uniref:Uncharacterized protein n=1 Tax=Actinoplanes couchii TaxID=403638 RepID=A0ABQ3X7E2_9ACTN|nr:hypothetical protein [Actinoplanes couchii]MDR6322271.1 hypothetical protein [Actinoplanes couchii]GID54430.1 hypothetical protein Aco03nite_028340 [Actinoplanes couchii]